MSSPREESRAVQRAGDLAGAAADAVDQLALRDDRRHFVAVGLVARAHHVVEVEGFAGQITCPSSFEAARRRLNVRASCFLSVA